MQIIIAGAGGWGREVAGWLKRQRKSIRGYIDDEKTGVMSTIKDYVPRETEEVLVCISDPKGREAVVKTLHERGAVFHGYIEGLLSPSARFGVGCILTPHSVMSNGSRIGDFCNVNLFSAVGHDVTVGSYCTLSSHVDLCGNVRVGDRVMFGSGCRVLPGVSIGDDCVIGAGSIVVKDVPAGTTVYAQPARTL